MSSNGCTRLCIPAFGFALGITQGVALFIIGFGASLSAAGWASKFIEVVGNAYVGYHATLVGAATGGLYGLAVGFCIGSLIAFLYNTVNRCCCDKTCETKG
ncbi:MAG: hypothetical protein JSS53_05675 [Proteobacteria bacterium]|nr:hypothetical protein [Pseudomonadota bacterium]